MTKLPNTIQVQILTKLLEVNIGCDEAHRQINEAYKHYDHMQRNLETGQYMQHHLETRNRIVTYEDDIRYVNEC